MNFLNKSKFPGKYLYLNKYKKKMAGDDQLICDCFGCKIIRCLHFRPIKYIIFMLYLWSMYILMIDKRGPQYAVATAATFFLFICPWSPFFILKYIIKE